MIVKIQTPTYKAYEMSNNYRVVSYIDHKWKYHHYDIQTFKSPGFTLKELEKFSEELQEIVKDARNDKNSL